MSPPDPVWLALKLALCAPFGRQCGKADIAMTWESRVAT